MPRLSDSMEEATIAAWLKRPGDRLKKGDPLVEVETDKATIVYEAETAGILGEILVAEGAAAALGAPIATLLPDKSVTFVRAAVRAATDAAVVPSTPVRPP